MIDSNKIIEITNKIVSGFSPDKIILFGSYANGNETDNSDLDLLIVKDTELPRHKRNIEIRRSFIGAKVPMDLLCYTNEEFEKEKKEKYSFLNQIIQTSKVLYER